MIGTKQLAGTLRRSSGFDIGISANEQVTESRKTWQKRLAYLLCLVILGTGTSRAQIKTRVITVRMEDDPEHKMVGVPCQINGGRHRYICVIDSGATNTIVSDRVLKAEGPLIELTTGNGIVRVHQREVALTISEGLELKSKALIQSMMLPGLDILVGQDVLRQFRSVIFDYETRQVEFQR